MLEHLKMDDILFLNLSTAPLAPSYAELSPLIRQLWHEKFRYLREPDTPEKQYEKAGLYAEFGKIICLSLGFVKTQGNERQMRIKSFYGHQEKELLTAFLDLLNTRFNKKTQLLAAHNGKEFDFPFLCRRLLINQIPLPVMLDLSGKKPWEVPHIDTMDFWRFGETRHYASLELLAQLFQIPMTQARMDGKEIAQQYWKYSNWTDIVATCQADVVLTAQLLLRFRGESIIPQEQISIAP
jgi:predicted PolB exonuclease-like 3'-5' exonuclease